MTRSPVFLLAMAAVLAIGVTPAVAADLTGTWEGTLKCTSYEHDQPPERDTMPVTARITQSETRINLAFDAVMSSMSGVAFDIGASLDEAAVAFATCPGGFPLTGTGKANGNRLRGDLTAVGGRASTIILCTFKLRRTDTADPGIEGCPEPP